MAAPGSRPGASGASSPKTTLGRATSCATPTSPSPAPSRTVSSSSTIPTSWWRASLSLPTRSKPPRRTCTSAASSGAGRRSSARRSPTQRKRATWAKASWARATTSRSSFTAAPVPTFAARRRRSSNRSRASAASRVSSHRSPRSPGCSASPPSSTTSKRSRACLTSSTGAPSGSPRSAVREIPGPSCFAFPATCSDPGWSSYRSACRSARSSSTTAVEYATATRSKRFSPAAPQPRS